VTITVDQLNRICAEWRERRCVTFDKVVAKELREKVTTTFQEDETSKPDINAAAQDIVTAAPGDPPSAPLLTVVYVYAHALRHWQVSMADWPVELLVEVCRRLTPHVNGQEGAVFRAFHGYIVWLEHGYQVENGLNCSCPIQTRQTGHDVRRTAETFRATLASITVSDPDVAQVVQILRLDVNAHLGYFGAVERVAATVEGLMDGTMDSAQLNDAIENVAEALAALKGDSHQSNLRPQLATLEALQRGQAEDQLRVESARLRFCYPFAMLKKEDDERAPGPWWRRPIRIFKKKGDEQEGHNPELVMISRESVDKAKEKARKASWLTGPQRLSDLWRDPQDAMIYTIELPNVIVKTSDALLNFSCEIRLRDAGNHSLILTHEFRPDTPTSPGQVRALRSLHLLNQAFRRATSSMGREAVCFEDEGEDQGAGETFETLTKLVEHTLKLIADSFDAEVVSSSDQRTPPAINVSNSDQRTPLAINDFHIVVSQIEFSVESATGLRPVRPDDFKTAVGASLLTREVRQTAATSLEEWLLLEPLTCDNLFEKQGRSGELALGTANTTVLYMPFSPDWVILDEHEEMVEFVVAQKALYRMWQRQLVRREKKLKKFSDRLRGTVKHKDKLPDSDERKMQDSVLDLLQLKATIGAEQARLHSLSVLRSNGYRDFLDALRRSALLTRLEDDLQATLQSLGEQHEQVSAMTTARVERRHNDSAAIIEFVLGTLAVFGILSWVRDLFNHEGWGGFSVELAIAVVAMIALWGLRAWRRRP
jgi:hypothetical protein